ncbi:MAG: hypothetical protein ACE5K4_05450 [Candidatus Hydrothermarchaeota archaeon]
MENRWIILLILLIGVSLMIAGIIYKQHYWSRTIASLPCLSCLGIA